MYLLTAVGVTVGYHRLLTHRAFQTYAAAPLRVRRARLDGGPGLGHRLGRRSPQAPRPHRRRGRPALARTSATASGIGGVLRGLWHAHTGWLMVSTTAAPTGRSTPPTSTRTPACAGSTATSSASSFARPRDPGARRLPPDRDARAAPLTALLWGGLVRVFFVHHVTWSVNSVCHFLGTRRFETEDRSTNVFWLALPSLGESWHHNHHAFPRSATHGLRWYELDPSSMIIRGDGAPRPRLGRDPDHPGAPATAARARAARLIAGAPARTAHRVGRVEGELQAQISIERVDVTDLPVLMPLMRAYCDFYEVAPRDDRLVALSRALIEDPGEGVQLLARERGRAGARSASRRSTGPGRPSTPRGSA